MLQSQLEIKERAGHGGQRRPATTRQYQPYPLPQPSSRESHKPPRTGLRESLGLLVLMLSSRAREMPAHDVQQGWTIAERWLRELVDDPLVGDIT